MATPNQEPVRIAVLGLGYVGCVTAACLADLGHHVIGVDRDEHKVRSILEAKAPFYEPGLEEIIVRNVAAVRLSASTCTEDALRDAAVALICVGTPSAKNGNLGLEQLGRVMDDIARCLAKHPHPIVIAVRSTVFPGTNEDVVAPALAAFPDAAVVSNPEFLREGTAVKDFVEPSLLVVGGTDPAAVRFVADLYRSLRVEPCLVSLRTAEMIKYACNAFHAVKISFANEVGALCTRLGVEGMEVMETLCRDLKLNISPAYLKPGFAFGGSCLPKDLRALTYRASRLDLQLPLLESTLPSNDSHLHRGIEAVQELPVKRIGVIGLAFKEDTDDLRESPVVSMLEFLIGKGRELRVFDPHIRLDAIYGSNRNFILNAIPHIGRLMESRIEQVIGWAEHLVVTQKLRPTLRHQVAESGLPVLDLSAGRF